MNAVLAPILVLHGGAGWADEIICLGLPLLLFLLISTSVGRKRGAAGPDTDGAKDAAVPGQPAGRPARDEEEEAGQ